MTGMAGYGPCATAMGVGVLTDTHSGQYSRVRVLGCLPRVLGGVLYVGAKAKYGTFCSDTPLVFCALHLAYDGTR